jgi:uncharacterized Zn finger protein (UPF0148 family)
VAERTCVDCGAPVVRTGKTGKIPERCPEHRVIRKRATDVAKKHRWQAANPERAREIWNKSNRKRLADPVYIARKRVEAVFRKYGLTPEQLAEMIAAQDGKCAICGGPPRGPGDRLHIDHCHESGMVRGLLCGKCNTLLGLADHEPERFLAAVRYLTK